MTYATLTRDLHENVCTLTLARPDRLNAFTVEMANELVDAFDAASRDDAVRAVIVTGAGRAFCAGMDLGVSRNVFGLNESLQRTRRDLDERLDNPEIVSGVRDTGGRVTLAIFDCAKPESGEASSPASIAPTSAPSAPQSSRCAFAASSATLLLLMQRLVCCIDRLNPPPKGVVNAACRPARKPTRRYFGFWLQVSRPTGRRARLCREARPRYSEKVKRLQVFLPDALARPASRRDRIPPVLFSSLAPVLCCSA
jgi:hypothetical protein